MSDSVSAVPMTICVTEPAASPLGRDLHLKDGDLLITVNGRAFTGDERDLAALFRKAVGGPLALGFRRKAADFTILAESPLLGLWEAKPAPGDVQERPLNPAILRNWEIVASSDNTYDLQPIAPGLLALIAAPIWLLQMRLWIPGAALLAAAMVSIAVSPVMFLAVYVASGLHIWYAGPRYFRKDRQNLGMTPVRVVAAPSERAAHAVHLRLQPDAKFAFAADKSKVEAKSPDPV